MNVDKDVLPQQFERMSIEQLTKKNAIVGENLHPQIRYTGGM
jgi:hypothetical protein